MSEIRFKPIRGLREKLLRTSLTEGAILFATDTGEMWMDTQGSRISLGGSGAVLIYGNGEAVEAIDSTGNYYYILSKEDLELGENEICKSNDLILNSDGAFYRIYSVNNSDIYCRRIAISGSGGGTGGGGSINSKPINITVGKLASSDFINGQSAYVTLSAVSTIGIDGSYLDEDLEIYWNLYEENADGTAELYNKGKIKGVFQNNEVVNFEFGSMLRENTTSTLEFYAYGQASGESQKRSLRSLTTSKLTLELPNTFSSLTKFKPNNVVLTCNTTGLNRIVKFYFDDELISSKLVTVSDSNGLGRRVATTSTETCRVPEEKATHGAHTCRIELYQAVKAADGAYDEESMTDPIEFEIAIFEPNNMTPVIWLGDYQSVYYNYDLIQIPFAVYNPYNSNEAIVNIKCNGAEIPSSPRTIDTTGESTWNYLEPDSVEVDMSYIYTISCGEAEKTAIFSVEKDGNRTMEYVLQDNLKLKFDATGRSNSESTTNREKLEMIVNGKTEKSTFKNFNWYNNGWVLDDNNQTCLRISNGAQLSIPVEKLIFNSGIAGQNSHTIEIQFKVKNIQDYSNLIKNITRYKDDSDYYNAFLAQATYDNYDAFLQYYLGANEFYATDGTRITQDDLKYETIQKNINLDKIVCGLYSGSGANITGFCMGSQDAFFSNGSDIVSTNYVEDEIINLSVVFDKDSSYIYMYLNGVITGIIESTRSGSFQIDSNNIIFNSNYCDIDLYKIRIYDQPLNVYEIATNYSVDKKDVLIYDQNGLVGDGPNAVLNEYQFSYEKMIEYNESHPKAPLMPYIVFDTSRSDDKLSWAKKIKNQVKVDFVNTVLDSMYLNGQLLDLAIADGLCTKDSSTENKNKAIKTYYKYHCPSFTGDYCELAVQGTSSQFYPRRNYKLKTKTSYDTRIVDEQGNTKSAVNIFLNKGPYADDYSSDLEKLARNEIDLGKETSRQSGWYMDNYTNPTTKWTLKVDFMESSGSYNAGFASMVQTAYSKHPLSDYLKAKALGSTNTEGKTAQKLLESKVTNSLNWNDYRTSVLGHEVLAFQKKSDGSYTFIGLYRMLLDKGSDEVFGFKPGKEITANFLEGKKVQDIAECWEFCNNSRGFCSYRDPWNRVELSFEAPEGAENGLTAEGGAPVIADNIEYRYNANEDYIDYLVNLKGITEKGSNAIKEAFGIDVDTTEEGQKNGRKLLLELYKNWEKVNKWVWSTNIDNVISQGTYVEVLVGDTLWAPNTYYIYDENSNKYILDTSANYEERIYYNKVIDSETGTVSYSNAHASSEDYLYAKRKFYIKNNDAYSLADFDSFDDTFTYYNLIEDEEKTSKGADLLVAPTSDTSYQEGTTYYYYDGSVTVGTRAVIEATDVMNAKDFSVANGKTLYVASPVTYKNRTYKYDTREYRADKFINELSKHFDIEYLATYFVMTEVFECYDSRGKNCMMASWGPLEEGGDYIWYPIFYDIDTQLGINNTGIPSFEYNVDATDAGNFSTSDSLLWNNFYKYFKNSYILMKYKHLKGITDNVDWPALSSAPLRNIDAIENWYEFKGSGSIMDKGQKPLIAKNLDMWFKYITIYNPKSENAGVAPLKDDGEPKARTNTAEWFFALQGDRMFSRKQFLTNRIEYIDSWLNQGNYQRGGANRIRGRVAANNATQTSDIWVNTIEKPYYNSEGNKNNTFDAEYWVNLKPIKSSYVTLSDDAEAYPSKKYDGINPTKFEIEAIKNGVMNSKNYPEQLLYIYGMNQMSDLGEMHNLYWQEFSIEGDASHLTALRLGTDEIVPVPSGEDTIDARTVEIDGKLYYQWHNDKVNPISIPSKKVENSKGMPLLKEVNLSNITINSATNSTTLDLTSCQKLQNFRAVGSNYTNFTFAEGVALNTLHLPNTITTLELTEANLLTKLIEKKPYPVRDSLGNLKVEEGLYIDGLFDENVDTNISILNLRGGNLGYDSLKLLNQFYEKVKNNGNVRNIQLTKVNWSPYIQLVEGDIYDSSEEYYLKNNHYGFDPYIYNEATFATQVLNGELYKLDKTISEETIAQSKGLAQMLLAFIDAKGKYKGISANSVVPNITGTVYIDNEIALDEMSDIKDKLVKYYPQLTFFFKKITHCYTAKFIIEDENGVQTNVSYIDSSITEPSVQKIKTGWFMNPYEIYAPTKDNYDFHGWSVTNNVEGLIASVDDSDEEKSQKWNSLTLEEDQTDYTFYAIFTLHKWKHSFYVGTSESDLTLIEDIYVENGSFVTPTQIKCSLPENDLDLTETYAHIGWTQSLKNVLATSQRTAKTVNFKTLISSQDSVYYGVFIKDSVYNNVLEEKYLSGELRDYQTPTSVNGSYPTSGVKGYYIELNEAFKSQKDILRGKITLPATYKGTPILGIQSQGFEGCDAITHIFFEKNTQIKEFRNNSFNECTNLQYIEMPDSLESIQEYGLANIPNLELKQLGGKNLRYVGRYAISGTTGSNTNSHDLTISGSVVHYMVRSINNITFLAGKTLQLGTESNPTQIDISKNTGASSSDPIFRFNDGSAPSRIVIYASDASAGEKIKDWITNGDFFVRPAPPVVQIEIH